MTSGSIYYIEEMELLLMMKMELKFNIRGLLNPNMDTIVFDFNNGGQNVSEELR